MPTQYTVDRADLAGILDAADLPDGAFTTTYRSLTMNGCVCLAMTGGLADLARVLIAAGQRLDLDHAFELFGRPQHTSDGFYWPRLTVSGEGFGRDGAWIHGSPDPLHVLM